MDAPTVRPYLQAGFGAPERQNRWTVAFRLILAVPHVVVLVAFGFVAYVVVVIGWFGALFMGRLPRWGAEFLGGFVLYATRVYAYLWLMTDQYPPFGWATGESYPVDVDVPYAPVRRLAVLFRIVLLVPAQIVAGLVSAGFNLVLVFVWLVVLVAGRMPLSLFGAVAAILRFQARYYAYAMMLTGKYPGELFGDASPSLPSAGFAPPVPPYPGAEAPRTARLVLAAASRRLLVLFLVLGVLEYAGIAAAVAVVGSSSHGAFDALIRAHDDLGAEISTAQSQLQSCGSNDLQCNETYQGQLAAAFGAFGADVSAINVPSSDQGDVQKLESDVGRLTSLLHQLASAPDVATYQSEIPQAQTLASQFDTDYSALAASLIF